MEASSLPNRQSTTVAPFGPPLLPSFPLHTCTKPPLSQKELSEPLWNSFYNSTVLMAMGITDQTTRDLYLTLLDEASTKFGSGCFVSSFPSSPFTRFSSPEFVTVLRNLFGLSATG